MPRLQARVDHYAYSHQTWPNKLLHFVGIPLLMVASLGLLAKASLPGWGGVPALQPNAAWVVLLGAGLWYVWLDWRIGILVIALFCGCYVAGSALSAGPLAALFAAGVVAHVLGHYGFEGKPPALLSNPVAVLEAPAWLVLTWAGLYR
jgi:uncharacterized membrane protein YGL010W